MLAIGIDPGTASSGYGLVRQAEDGSLESLAYGVIATEAGLPMAERLASLHRALSEFLALHRPDCAAVEALFFQKNVSTAISVGQARGVALLALAQAGVPVSEYSPRAVKLAIAGYGNAGKKQMQEMVRTLLGMPEIPRPDDAADALAVAICHLHSSGLQRLLEDRE
ncbi:MAG TPA: crossover junction endodeoxyribonuclease RuvC [Anaerolineales bacterium]|nr:crossover junction endodeoxyribonuclease RuvC [Anaerolineales bacterium]